MTEPKCPHKPRDAYLCRGCTARLRKGLADLAELHRELLLTAYRLDRIAPPGGGRGNGDKPLPWRPNVTPLVREVEWAMRALPPAEDIAKHRGDALAVLNHVMALCAEARTAVDLPQTHRYLGACDTCSRALYADRTRDVHQCKCGHTYNVDRRVEALRRRSADVVASPATIATALTSLDQPVTEERIRKWKERGRLTPRSLNGPRRQPWYRVGDVQALLEADERETARRAALRRDTRT